MSTLWEKPLHDARRRAPANLDFDALTKSVLEQNNLKILDWKQTHSGLDVAVVEIRIRASGRVKHRMRRYRELTDFNGQSPGWLIARSPTHVDWAWPQVVIIAAAAARAGVSEVEWRFLTAAEALTPAP